MVGFVVEYDAEVDAAYIYLIDRIEAGGVSRTVPCDPREVGMINLDFDGENRLIGIEVLGALNALPPELLARATKPGGG